jgi:transposase
MCRLSPFVITLPDTDRAELQRRARCYTLPHAVVVRAKIVLLAAEGLKNTQIAARLDVHVNVVSRWRGRFAREGLGGLGDRRRPGRPRVFPAAVVAQVKAMACEPPEDRRVPQSRWSAADLAAQARAEGLVESVARSTVWRWLEEDAIRPWRYRSWIFPRYAQLRIAGAMRSPGLCRARRRSSWPWVIRDGGTAHSHRLWRKARRRSPALKRTGLPAGGSRRCRAASFIARSAST